MRVGLYCRVSTTEQNLETQLLQLREYAQRRGFQVLGEYTDAGISGMRDRRPGLDRLMKAARFREIEAVLVFKFDRFARSTSHLIRSLDEFRALGIEFISLMDSVDTSTPAGKAMFGMLAVFAEFERNIIVERVNAGIARAKKQGKHCGRPVAIFDRGKAQELRQAGMSNGQIAKALGTNRETVRKAIRVSKPG